MTGLSPSWSVCVWNRNILLSISFHVIPKLQLLLSLSLTQAVQLGHHAVYGLIREFWVPAPPATTILLLVAPEFFTVVFFCLRCISFPSTHSSELTSPERKSEWDERVGMENALSTVTTLCHCLSHRPCVGSSRGFRLQNRKHRFRA